MASFARRLLATAATKSFAPSRPALSAKMTTPAPRNTRYSVNVLTTSTADTSPSLLVVYDNQRYLFNTPEAMSRVCVQGKTGMRKISNVFLGDLVRSAGLPGFLLSTVEAGNNKVEVVGPEGTEHLVASYRFFTRRCGCRVRLILGRAALTERRGQGAAIA